MLLPQFLSSKLRQYPREAGVSWCEQNRTSVRAKQDMGVRAKQEYGAGRPLGRCLCWVRSGML
jgi:hypothetical protein